MTRAYWKKTFPFSASFEKDGKIHGHNFLLSLKVPFSPALNEKKIVDTVQRELLQKIHSRDLSLHVDFLQGKVLSDAVLIKEFATVLKKVLKPLKITSITLQKDSRTEIEWVF